MSSFSLCEESAKLWPKPNSSHLKVSTYSWPPYDSTSLKPWSQASESELQPVCKLFEFGLQHAPHIYQHAYHIFILTAHHADSRIIIHVLNFCNKFPTCFTDPNTHGSIIPKTFLICTKSSTNEYSQHSRDTLPKNISVHLNYSIHLQSKWCFTIFSLISELLWTSDTVGLPFCPLPNRSIKYFHNYIRG